MLPREKIENRQCSRRNFVSELWRGKVSIFIHYNVSIRDVACRNYTYTVNTTLVWRRTWASSPENFEKHSTSETLLYGISRSLRGVYIYSLQCTCIYHGRSLAKLHSKTLKTLHFYFLAPAFDNILFIKHLL